jgi:hypothetical protein
MYKLVPLKTKPGFKNNGTAYQSKERWLAGNFVRFFQDTIQPIGGWSKRTLTGATIQGVPRHAVQFKLNTGETAVCVGTTGGLYVIVSNVVYDITPADEVSAGLPTTDLIWSLDVFGSWVIAVAARNATTLAAGQMYEWHGNTGAVATTIVNGPLVSGLGRVGASIRSVVITAERFVVALGGYTPGITALLHAQSAIDRLVFWADQESTASADWTSSATNQAGDFPLASSGSLQQGKRSRGTTLLWTTHDLWSMEFIGGELIYRFALVGDSCGSISKHAVASNDTQHFWMGHNGFFMYDGFVKPIPCEVQDYVFGSLNRTYAHYIWAYANTAFGEITWHYPSANATECDRYVTYNYREDHWVFGTLARTAGVSFTAPGVVPVLFKDNADLFDHETGTGRNNEGTPSAESGPFEIADGDNLVALQKVIPDDKTVGDVNLTLYTAPNPDTAETTSGPYTLAAQTSIRLKGRQIRMKLTEAAANAWRVGVIRIGVLQSTRR